MDFVYKKKKAAVILLAVITLLCVSGRLFAVSASDNGYQQLLKRCYTMRTSYNPAAYAVFTANGDTVHIEGNYERTTITDIRITDCESAAKSFKRSGSSFIAEINAAPAVSHSQLCLSFDGGVSYFYRIEYDNGWFFGDNGLSDSYSDSIESVIEMPVEAAALYLSATENPGEIRYALDELTRIAAEVTAYAADDYEKARLLSAWVAENIYYDYDARDSSVTADTIALYNVLQTRRTVCAGFANMYAALLEAVGIRAVNIKGSVTASSLGITYENLGESAENHEWCAFYCEAEQRWVLTDACWNSGNNYKGGSYNKGMPHEKYFDITPLAFSLNHRADKAEQRAYFKALDYSLQTTTETSPPVTTADSGAATLPESTATAKPAAATAVQPADVGSDDTVLYIIVGIMSVFVIGAAGIVVFIFVTNRKK